MRSTVWLWALLFFIYGHAWAAEAPAAPVKRLAAIQGSSIFLDKTGTMWWWGGGDPKPAPVLRGVTAMAFGGGANFVIKDDATLWGKGNSTYGQLGFFSKKRIEQYVKIFTDVLAVASADNTVYALKKDHTLWTWGRHNSYEKGARKKPEKILDKVVQVAAAMMHTVALREDGTLWSWGSNRCGRLGAYKDIDSRSRPGKMDMEALEGRAVTGIVVCMDESYAVTEDGLVWRWGEHLPKCESMPPYASSPERLPFINNVRRIAVNEYSNYFLALKKDGSLWA